MRVSESTASLNAVESSGLVRLYTTTLEGRGYQSLTVHAYVGAVEHFIAWAAPKTDRVEIREASIRRFLDEHLNECDCPGRLQRGKVTTRSALRHLLAILRAAGLLAATASNLPESIQTEVWDFCCYASDVCGLAPATLISRRQWIGRFLTHHFPTGGLDLSRLGPKEVRNFFIAQCEGYRPGSSQVVASAIRSYLRFRAVRYADPVESLIAAIPSAARWRLAPLPEYLGPAELTKLMAAFDRKRPQSQRDYASVIRSVVRQAAARSGLSGRLHGPHLLRHSAATRMLHGGATLKEIADILRHRSLDTTAIYAKVDIARLSAIAQPWPGGVA